MENEPMLEKPVVTETINWKGTDHTLELFATDQMPPEAISQVQCIAFTKEGKVVLYQHAAGYIGLPGGTVETGESVETALMREVREESASQVITYQQIAYLKDTNEASGEVQFQTRYYAEVELLDEQVVDPDGKALERLIVEPEAVVALLGDGWGERGAVLLKLALDARNKIVG